MTEIFVRQLVGKLEVARELLYVQDVEVLDVVVDDVAVYNNNKLLLLFINLPVLLQDVHGVVNQFLINLLH